MTPIAFMRLAAAASLGAVLLTASVPAAHAWDDDVDYFDHRDTITRGAGDASATNLATQTIDPWHRYTRNTKITVDGKRAQIGMTRYQQNKSIPPHGLSASTNTGGNRNGNGPQTTK